MSEQDSFAAGHNMGCHLHDVVVRLVEVAPAESVDEFGNVVGDSLALLDLISTGLPVVFHAHRGSEAEYGGAKEIGIESSEKPRPMEWG